MRPALLLAACLLVQSAAAGAATLTLKQASEPASYQPTGVALDVAGIKPGMAPEAVRTILAAQFGEVQVVKDNLGLEYRGVDVATETYVTKMFARKDADEITVWFATPTTGNAVVEVTQQTSYANPPDTAQIRAEVIAKYGPPGFDGPAVGNGEIRLLAWSFKGDKPAPCPRSSCRAYVSDGLSVGNMAVYQRAVATGHELTVIATLLSSIGDPSKVSSALVTISDAATKLRTLDGAIAQMKAAATPAGREKPRKP